MLASQASSLQELFDGWRKRVSQDQAAASAPTTAVLEVNPFGLVDWRITNTPKFDERGILVASSVSQEAAQPGATMQARRDLATPVYRRRFEPLRSTVTSAGHVGAVAAAVASPIRSRAATASGGRRGSTRSRTSVSRRSLGTARSSLLSSRATLRSTTREDEQRPIPLEFGPANRFGTSLRGTVIDVDGEGLPNVLKRVNVEDDSRPYMAPYNTTALENPAATRNNKLFWPKRAAQTVEFFSPEEMPYVCRVKDCPWRFQTAGEAKVAVCARALVEHVCLLCEMMARTTTCGYTVQTFIQSRHPTMRSPRSRQPFRSANQKSLPPPPGMSLRPLMNPLSHVLSERLGRLCSMPRA